MDIFSRAPGQGSRSNWCPTCGGSGARSDCPICNGTGKKLCTVCFGARRPVVRASKMNTWASAACFGCAGFGKMSCMCRGCITCGGKGEVPSASIGGADDLANAGREAGGVQ